MAFDVKSELEGRLTVPVETAGKAYGLGRNASYRAVKKGLIDGIKIGGKWVCPTAPILRRLQIETGAKAA